MTIPRISSLLVMLALGQDVLALQMGQISSESVRGQPLAARVTLYGMPPATDGTLAAELLPAFGAPADSLSMFGVRARIETDAQGVQAIVITSDQPIADESLSLRVRLQDGARATVRHYELTIPAARPARGSALPRLSHALPVIAAPRGVQDKPPVTAQPGSYGPVRAGQSLWSILEQTGLARGDMATLMRTIVAANPEAFVAGDATRLRVGATLRLSGMAPVADAVPATPAPRAPRAAKPAADAETAARLERLAIKFAEIRARYAAQKSDTAASPSPLTAGVVAADTEKSTPPAVALSPVVQPAAAVATQSTAIAKPTPAAAHAESIKPTPPLRDNADSANSESLGDKLAQLLDGKVLLTLGASLLLAALLLVGTRLGRRLRGRVAEAGLRSADRELVAEIGRKAEKRVQLEDEVKRMIAGRRDGADEPVASASNGLCPADLLHGARASLEDIETRIAHGQYNEAEAMLEQTIADTPNNHRAKLRLAEIYYLNERHEEFVDLADEIHRQHRSDIGDENWARLMRMGKVIAPDRPPFSGPVAVEAGRRAR